MTGESTDTLQTALTHLGRAELELVLAKAVLNRMGRDDLWQRLNKSDEDICAVLNILHEADTHDSVERNTSG